MPDGSGRPENKLLTTLPAIAGSTEVNRAVVEAAQGPRRPLLVVISGPDVDQRRPVDKSLLIGRDPSCDFVLSDAQVSGRHALLEDRGDNWTLVDLQAKRGGKNRVSR